MSSQTKDRVSLREIIDATTPFTNWSKFAVHPFADRLLWLIVNHTRITPNMVTAGALLLSVLVGVMFVRGDHLGFVVGAVAFYLSFALDTIDGALARLTKKTSKLGAFLDIMGDYVRSAIACVTLVYGVWRHEASDFVLGLGLVFVVLTLAHYHLGQISITLLGTRPAALLTESTNQSNRLIPRLIRRFGLIPNPFGLAEYEAVAIVLAPALGVPVAGMIVAVVLGAVARTAALTFAVRRLLNAA